MLQSPKHTQIPGVHTSLVFIWRALHLTSHLHTQNKLQAVQRTPTSPWVGVERWATLTSEAAAELRSGGRKTSDAWRVRVRATAAELHTLWERRIRVRSTLDEVMQSSGDRFCSPDRMEAMRTSVRGAGCPPAAGEPSSWMRGKRVGFDVWDSVMSVGKSSRTSSLQLLVDPQC